jgi:hypothetical protein
MLANTKINGPLEERNWAGMISSGTAGSCIVEIGAEPLGKAYPTEQHKLASNSTVSHDSDEGLLDDHGHGIWVDHFGACLARLRRRASPGEGARVYFAHDCRRGSVFLGVALAGTLLAPMMSPSDFGRVTTSRC